MGKTRMENRFSKTQLREVVADYKRKTEDGRWEMSLEQVAQKYNIAKSSVMHIVQKEGIWRKPSYAKKRGLEAKRILGPRHHSNGTAPAPSAVATPIPVAHSIRYSVLMLDKASGAPVVLEEDISLGGVLVRLTKLAFGE